MPYKQNSNGSLYLSQDPNTIQQEHAYYVRSQYEKSKQEKKKNNTNKK
jgi:hypothetical protein